MHLELAVLPGLEDLALDELRSVAGSTTHVRRPRAGVLAVDAGLASVAERMRIAGAAYLTLAFDVPRPAALLGDQSLRRVVALAQRVASRPAQRFTGVRISVVFANPPWGHQMGSHATNDDLYPALLAEAARVTRPGGRTVLLSHEVRLVERLVDSDEHWQVRSVTSVTMRGHHPRIWLLRRRGRTAPGSP